MSWLRRLFSTRRLERDLDKELRFHVESRTEDLRREGVAPAEARRRALAEFGCVEPIKEAARDARGTRWVGDLGQDLRYAFRVMWSARGFTAAAIVSLGVGLGANTAVFRVMDGVMFRPLDVPRPSELFFLHSSLADESRFSHPAYVQLASASPTAILAASSPPTMMQVAIDGVAQLVTSQLVTGNWFDVVGISETAGRLLRASDDLGAGEPPVVVISESPLGSPLCPRTFNHRRDAADQWRLIHGGRCCAARLPRRGVGQSGGPVAAGHLAACGTASQQREHGRCGRYRAVAAAGRHRMAHGGGPRARRRAPPAAARGT
jgi:hypothetical protein